MKRNFKNTAKVLSLGLAFALCCSGAIRSSGGITATRAADGVAPVYEDGTELFKKELYLGAWCEPYISDENFENFKDYGFNVMYINNAVEYRSLRLPAYLKACEKHGLKAVLSGGMNRRTPISLRYLKENISNYPAFYGVMIIDEPLGDGSPNGVDEVPASEYTGGLSHNTIYDYIYNEYEYINETYPGKMAETVVTFSPYSSGFGHGANTAYVEKVLAKTPQEDRVLSWDIYPYGVDGDGSQSSFSSSLYKLYYWAEAAKDYNVPKRLHYYQQLWSYEIRESLSVDEFLYQFYMAMCFGANGFVAYKYGTYWQDYAYPRQFTMNTAWGATEVCYYNKIALEEIKKFDHIYLDFADQWQGVMFLNGSEVHDENMGYSSMNLYYPERKYELSLENIPGISAASATRDTIVGCYKDKSGRDGYMFTNNTLTLNRVTDDLSVTFPGKTRAMVVEKGEVKDVELTNNTYSTVIPSGGGVFVIPY